MVKLKDRVTGIIPRECVSKNEWSFLKSLKPDELDILNDIVLKMCKQENEKCIEAVMYHKRYYTTQLEEIAKSIRERYE